MNPFTIHPQKQGLTYFEHWVFAMGIAGRMLTSVIAFMMHATFPFISIERRLDLDATRAFLAERNQWLEMRKAAKVTSAATDVDGENAAFHQFAA